MKRSKIIKKKVLGSFLNNYFLKMFLHMEYYNKTKNEFIQFCREQYSNDPHELKIIIIIHLFGYIQDNVLLIKC